MECLKEIAAGYIRYDCVTWNEYDLGKIKSFDQPLPSRFTYIMHIRHVF